MLTGTETAATTARPGTVRLGNLRGFLRMPFGEKILMFVAWILLGLVAAVLGRLPFRRLAPLLGKPIGPIGCIPLASEQQSQRARLVRRAVFRAARLAPFRSDCLPQAFVAAVLCRLLGVPATTHLGVKLGDGPEAMAAHAWVCSGQEWVTGGRSFGTYTPVSCFLIANSAGPT
jgi:hypothetical protein